MSDVSGLGEALRAWRERISPDAAGLAGQVTGSGTGTRRTAGLRREELALLAGVSADYVTRLEQGRASSPSGQVAGALARALRLDDAEQRHLFRLAGLPEPGPRVVPTALTPGVTRLLDQLEAVPVSVYDAAWNLIAWNAMWAGLVGDPGPLAGRERNVLWQHFTGQRGRVVHTPEDDELFGRSTVAALRAASSRYPDDEGLHALVSDLLEVSPEFARLWRAQLVGLHETDRKQVVHPEVGAIWVDCDVLHVDGNDLRVVVYTTAPGSPDADKLRQCRGCRRCRRRSDQLGRAGQRERSGCSTTPEVGARAGVGSGGVGRQPDLAGPQVDLLPVQRRRPLRGQRELHRHRDRALGDRFGVEPEPGPDADLGGVQPGQPVGLDDGRQLRHPEDQLDLGGEVQRWRLRQPEGQPRRVLDQPAALRQRDRLQPGLGRARRELRGRGHGVAGGDQPVVPGQLVQQQVGQRGVQGGAQPVLELGDRRVEGMRPGGRVIGPGSRPAVRAVRGRDAVRAGTVRSRTVRSGTV